MMTHLSKSNLVTVCMLLMKTGLCLPKFSLHFKRFCTFVSGGRGPLSLGEGPLHFDASLVADSFSRRASDPNMSLPAGQPMKLLLF